MILRTDSGGIKTRGSTGAEVWGRVQMKNIRSNCMTKPPWAWFGGGLRVRGWVSGNVGSRGGRGPGQSIVRYNVWRWEGPRLKGSRQALQHSTFTLSGACV